MPIAPPLMQVRWLCVSMHDVSSATWERCKRVLAAVRAVADIPVTLLVVPAYHGSSTRPDAAFVHALRQLQAQGHELALHGYAHLDPHTSQIRRQAGRGTGGHEYASTIPRLLSPIDRGGRGVVAHLQRHVYTEGEGEFSALDEADARLRLQLGLDWFAEQGWTPDGFVAPAWLMSRGAWRALLALRRFKYTTTLSRFHVLPTDTLQVPAQGQHLQHLPHSLPAPCVVYSTRSAWRRTASRAFTRMWMSWWRNTPLLRLALHPHDADHPAVLDSWQGHLAQLCRERCAITKATAAQICHVLAPAPTSAASAAAVSASDVSV